MIILNGERIQTMRISSTFSDPGAYAIDESSTTITSFGAEALQTALGATDLSELGDASNDNSVYGPWIISYTGASI